MKQMALITTILLTFTGVANGLSPQPTPAPSPAPSLLGIWYLVSRACTSAAEVKDGLEIGIDTVQIAYNPDLSFEEKITLQGCESVTKGTYTIQDRKIITTSSEVKHCKDQAPVPITENKVTYMAYLDENETVTVTTGLEAARVCPAGDALVKIFSKIILQSERE